MQKWWQLPKTHLTIKVFIIHWYTTHRQRKNLTNPLDFVFVLLQIQVHGSLTSTYGRIQSSPWILTLAVLVGSVGFTVLVLAFFMLQNRRICSRRKCLWPHLGPGHTHPPFFWKSLFFLFLANTGRTYDSSDDMELVTNIIVNPNYQAESDRTLLTSNEGHNDRQALLTCNFMVPRRPAVSL